MPNIEVNALMPSKITAINQAQYLPLNNPHDKSNCSRPIVTMTIPMSAAKPPKRFARGSMRGARSAAIAAPPNNIAIKPIKSESRLLTIQKAAMTVTPRGLPVVDMLIGGRSSFIRFRSGTTERFGVFAMPMKHPTL